MQTKWQSLIEAFFNTLTGYIISVIAQVIIFPWFGIQLPLHTNMVIVAMFTIISIVRSYFWRRFFNKRHNRAAAVDRATSSFNQASVMVKMSKPAFRGDVVYTPALPCARCNGHLFVLGDYPGTTRACPACQLPCPMCQGAKHVNKPTSEGVIAIACPVCQE